MSLCLQTKIYVGRSNASDTGFVMDMLKSILNAKDKFCIIALEINLSSLPTFDWSRIHFETS